MIGPALRRALPRLLLLLSVLTLIAGSAELFARWTWRDRAEAADHSVDPDLPRLHSVADLAGSRVHGIHRGVLYRTNRHGFRGPERTRDPAPGTIRIGVAGDSVAAGWGVAEDRTYAAQLEQMLNRDAEDAQYEVLNVALAGQNARESVLRLQKAVNLYRMHHVVYGFTLNDIEGPRYVRLDKKGSYQRYQELLALTESRSYLVRWLGPQMLWLRDRLLDQETGSVAELRYNYLENDAAYADFEHALERLARIARRRDFCVSVLVTSQLDSLRIWHPYSEIYEKVAETARKHGFHVILSLDRFLGSNATEYWLSPTDPHPNEEGHRVLAEVLRAGLATREGGCGLTGDAATANEIAR